MRLGGRAVPRRHSSRVTVTQPFLTAVGGPGRRPQDDRRQAAARRAARRRADDRLAAQGRRRAPPGARRQRAGEGRRAAVDARRRRRASARARIVVSSEAEAELGRRRRGSSHAHIHAPSLSLGVDRPGGRRARAAPARAALRGARHDGVFDDDDAGRRARVPEGERPRRARASSTPSLWALLARAGVPQARYGGDHVEVDKTRQVLFLVRDGKVALTTHVSTGATGNTPLGEWHVYSKVAGWSWVLWYPNYFLRGFAIHGYPEVPAYPASHGCVRVPMWLAPSALRADPDRQRDLRLHLSRRRGPGVRRRRPPRRRPRRSPPPRRGRGSA